MTTRIMITCFTQVHVHGVCKTHRFLLFKRNVFEITLIVSGFHMKVNMTRLQNIEEFLTHFNILCKHLKKTTFFYILLINWRGGGHTHFLLRCDLYSATQPVPAWNLNYFWTVHLALWTFHILIFCICSTGSYRIPPTQYFSDFKP